MVVLMLMLAALVVLELVPEVALGIVRVEGSCCCSVIQATTVQMEGPAELELELLFSEAEGIIARPPVTISRVSADTGGST